MLCGAGGRIGMSRHNGLNIDLLSDEVLLKFASFVACLECVYDFWIEDIQC